MKFKPFTPRKYRRRVFSQLWMLALQFILGMLLNLIDSDSTGAKHAFYIAILILHILNAIGLVEGGFFIALKASSKLSWWAAVIVAATLCFGVVTVITGQNIWSFLMACGFLASGWVYGMLYIRAEQNFRSGSKAL